MRHGTIIRRPSTSRPSRRLDLRSPFRAALTGILLLLLWTPFSAVAESPDGTPQAATLRDLPARFAVTLPYRSVAISPDYQSGLLAGLFVQIQDETDQPVTGRWPILLTLYCDSGCTGPGRHVDPAEVAFDNGGYVFLGLTQTDGTQYVSLTTATIGAGINITSQVLADNTALISPVRSRYAELLAGAGLHWEPEDHGPGDHGLDGDHGPDGNRR